MLIHTRESLYSIDINKWVAPSYKHTQPADLYGDKKN